MCSEAIAGLPAPRPLGMPPGSVRALVALTVVGVFVLQTLRGQSAGILLSEAMLIVLAHYFASRRLLTIPAHLRAQLQVQGVIQEDPNPLWLPRNSVRTLILVALLGTLVVLTLRGDLLRIGVLDNLMLAYAYLLGVVINQVRQRRPLRPLTRLGRTWMHLKALLVLVVCLLIVLLALTGVLGGLPRWIEQTLLGWLLFYFGSR